MDFKEAYQDTCSTVAMAARTGDAVSLKQLIKKGKPVDVKDNRGWMAIHEAAYHGHAHCIKLLLKQDDIEVDTVTFETETALLLASRMSRVECVKYLLAAGADANAATNEGFSPLWEATQSRSLECVSLLLEAGAHVNHRIYTNDTPLHVVIQMHSDVDIVNCLLEAGADYRMKTENGHTPLFVAAQFGQRDCLQILTEHAKQKGLTFLERYVNTPAVDDASPLYIAAQEDKVDCCDLLLKNGANPHQSIIYDEGIRVYPLQIAIYKNNLRCLEALVKVTDLKTFKWNIEQKFSRKRWQFHPLILAMGHEDGKCLRCLLQNGYEELLLSRYTPDLFQYHVELKPVVILAKQYGSWMRECFSSEQFDFYKVMQRYNRQTGERIHVFVVLLRLGVVKQKELHLKQAESSQEVYNKSYLHLLAMYRYSDKTYTFCEECRTLNRFNCVECLHMFGWSPVGILTRVCLVPNLLRCNVDEWIMFIVDHDVTLGGTNDSDSDSDEIYAKMETVLTKMYQIKDTCSNLQHLCRTTVVYRLIHNNNYTREGISTLPIPKTLQSYLQYTEYKTISRALMNGFKQLQKIERTVDKLFEETENIW